MSIYTSDIVKPVTQVFSQQPKHYSEINAKISKNYLLNHPITESKVLIKSNKKPVAYVIPIETLKCTDQAIQTDSISIDINSIIDIHDFQRSERIIGKLDIFKNNIECNDLETACKRIAYLEETLNQQLKNNEDIKKLLIASLGEDLAAHYIKLTSDVAGLKEKVHELVFTNKELNENVDKLSIEADLWKNKFIAGRVLVDELAGWKEQFSMRYKESLEAIHGFLQERQVLRRFSTLLRNELLLILTHLNFKPISYFFSNTLDLTQTNLKLLETIKTMLCNGSVWNNHITIEHGFMQDFRDFTDGEELALKVLRNQPNLYADNTARITTSFSSENSQCLEKIADKICKNCKGDIFVI